MCISIYAFFEFKLFKTVTTHALALGELGKGKSKGRMEVHEKSK